MRVLVTGATGYIGSHTVIELLDRGHEVIGVDDFSASSPEVRSTIDRIAGRRMEFIEIDLRNRNLVNRLVKSADADAVIHFAGRKFVAESVTEPLRYYSRNVTTSINLAEACTKHGVKKIIFSSSCTVYGNPTVFPVAECNAIQPVSPYGRTKAVIEAMFEDLCSSDPSLSVMALRYFNPIGAHPSGRLGEVQRGVPNSLLPFVMQVARGERPLISVYGDDYDTTDGTCVRDYVHVVDIARAHAMAVDFAENETGFTAMNLGTGVGRSVLEVIEAVRRVTGQPVHHQVTSRRPGDAAVVFAEPSRAKQLLGWEADTDLDRMVGDHWRFEQAQLSAQAIAS